MGGAWRATLRAQFVGLFQVRADAERALLLARAVSTGSSRRGRAVLTFVGARVGQLTVIAVPLVRQSNYRVRVRCDCGREYSTSASSLASMRGEIARARVSASGGDYRRRRVIGACWWCSTCAPRTHGATTRGAGAALNKMALRHRMMRHQGRLHPAWEDFTVFLHAVGLPPRGRTFLVAEDTRRPVGPGNAIWSDIVAGAGVSYRGVRLSFAGWAKVLDVSRERVRQRMADSGGMNAGTFFRGKLLPPLAQRRCNRCGVVGHRPRFCVTSGLPRHAVTRFVMFRARVRRELVTEIARWRRNVT